MADAWSVLFGNVHRFDVAGDLDEDGSSDILARAGHQDGLDGRFGHLLLGADLLAPGPIDVETASVTFGNSDADWDLGMNGVTFTDFNGDDLGDIAFGTAWAPTADGSAMGGRVHVFANGTNQPPPAGE